MRRTPSSHESRSDLGSFSFIEGDRNIRREPNFERTDRVYRATVEWSGGQVIRPSTYKSQARRQERANRAPISRINISFAQPSADIDAGSPADTFAPPPNDFESRPIFSYPLTQRSRGAAETNRPRVRRFVIIVVKYRNTDGESLRESILRRRNLSIRERFP